MVSDPFLTLLPGLPPPLDRLHDGQAQVWRGEARIEPGRSPVARLALWFGGYPRQERGGPLRLVITPAGPGGAVHWQRHFGPHVTRSRLTRAGACVMERFGPVTLVLHPVATRAGFALTVAGARIFGLPLPRVFWPKAEAREWAEAGAVAFDIAARLPWGAPLIRYSGRLRAA